MQDKHTLYLLFRKQAYEYIAERMRLGLPITTIKCSSMQSKKRRAVRDKFSGKKCIWCKQPTTHGAFTIEHVKPFMFDGTSSLDNLAPACFNCNQQRGIAMLTMVNLAYAYGKEFLTKYKP